MNIKYCRYFNSLQNETKLSKKKLITVKIPHSKVMGCLVITCMAKHN